MEDLERSGGKRHDDSNRGRSFGYEFGTQRTWGGISITAVRQDGADRPGLYVVVTDDLNEMRRALLEYERPSRQ